MFICLFGSREFTISVNSNKIPLKFSRIHVKIGEKMNRSNNELIMLYCFELSTLTSFNLEISEFILYQKILFFDSLSIQKITKMILFESYLSHIRSFTTFCKVR